MKRYAFVFLAIVITIAAPMLLQPKASSRTEDYAAQDRLVIITPHVETIRYELEQGFSKWMKEKYQRSVVIDWRIPGGTSEIIKVIKSDFTAAFENDWKRSRGDATWGRDFPSVYADSRSTSPAREAFLRSNVGMGVDLMLGGGPIDYDGLKRSGYIVATDASGKFGPAAVQSAHPDWFADRTLPPSNAGQPYYDAEYCWIGTCLSAFGICYNADTLRDHGITEPPKTWSDLAAPHYENQLAISDPTKSGTVAAMFEVILQIEIQKTMSAVSKTFAAGLATEQNASLEGKAIEEGWLNGLRLIQRIGANARYWTDTSTKIPLDVARGDALAGMCVDFYGRNFVERLLQANHGRSRLVFFAPHGGTTISPQPIAMMRGAPNPGLATQFVEFILSLEGQRLWGHRAGTPGGPIKMALRNMPIRRDYYTPDNLAYAADPELRPMEPGVAFVYEPKYTADLFMAIRTLIRAMCIDPHEELKDAWHELIVHQFPPRAMEVFNDLQIVGYSKIKTTVVTTLKERNAVMIAAMTRDLSDQFRRGYLKVVELARHGS